MLQAPEKRNLRETRLNFRVLLLNRENSEEASFLPHSRSRVYFEIGVYFRVRRATASRIKSLLTKEVSTTSSIIDNRAYGPKRNLSYPIENRLLQMQGLLNLLHSRSRVYFEIGVCCTCSFGCIQPQYQPSSRLFGTFPGASPT